MRDAARSTPLSRALRWQSRWWTTSDSQPLVGLIGVTLLIGAALWSLPAWFPLMLLLVPLVVASVLLGPRLLPWYVVFLLLVLAIVAPQQPVIDTRTLIAVAVIFGLGLYFLFASFRRSRLGVAGLRGESMLVDLRDRILKQGRIPDLPPSWYAASELRSAGGTAFAGDFVVASRVGDRLDLAVVDVSGKGERAATRALLLSGALGGLLGAVPPAQFLPAANDFLLRQEWEEGFATAVHLSIDLGSGDFIVRTAGHPPAVRLTAGSGRWSPLESEGPVLGLIEWDDFEGVTGRMGSGDAILLYTDGLVESHDRDISLGIDRMVGAAERLLRGGFDGGAERLIEAVGSANDDRALLLVHRR
jgi:hypothetical protein